LTAPRLEINLRKIRHNACVLVNSLKRRGISVSGVTKATQGRADIAEELLAAGVTGLADSRIENIQAMRGAAVNANMMLIRSPMISQAALVVANADTSFNTELDVISELSKAAHAIGRTHGIQLMVELGDLREGIMPGDVAAIVRRTLGFPNFALIGIGANLACRCGVGPDAANMGELSALANMIEATFGHALTTVSGGGSSNIAWALSGADTGRVNNLRLGESILLGREPLHNETIEGLYTDSIALVAEVIESKIKPSQPWGPIAATAFGAARPVADSGSIFQAILALGRVDTDPDGLTPPPGIEIIGSSSDHLVVSSGPNRLAVGTEVAFQLNYSALIRTMASQSVEVRGDQSTEPALLLEPAFHAMSLAN